MLKLFGKIRTFSVRLFSNDDAYILLCKYNNMHHVYIHIIMYLYMDIMVIMNVLYVRM